MPEMSGPFGVEVGPDGRIDELLTPYEVGDSGGWLTELVEDETNQLLAALLIEMQHRTVGRRRPSSRPRPTTARTTRPTTMSPSPATRRASTSG
jgi:hypothetical protein